MSPAGLAPNNCIRFPPFSLFFFTDFCSFFKEGAFAGEGVADLEV
jgi:hypothetical protein